MVARYAGAGLGLLAFAITTVAGLLVQNPVGITLSRSILALFLFCLIGLVLGTAAQRVVAEHEKQSETKIRERYREETPDAVARTMGGSPENPSESVEARSTASAQPEE